MHPNVQAQSCVVIFSDDQEDKCSHDQRDGVPQEVCRDMNLNGAVDIP